MTFLEKKIVDNSNDFTVENSKKSLFLLLLWFSSNNDSNPKTSIIYTRCYGMVKKKKVCILGEYVNENMNYYDNQR